MASTNPSPMRFLRGLRPAVLVLEPVDHVAHQLRLVRERCLGPPSDVREPEVGQQLAVLVAQMFREEGFKHGKPIDEAGHQVLRFRQDFSDVRMWARTSSNQRR